MHYSSTAGIITVLLVPFWYSFISTILESSERRRGWKTNPEKI